MSTCSCIVFTAVLIAQPPELPPFVKSHSQSVMFYYKSPDPQVGPKMLKDLLKKENLEHPWFAKNSHVLNLISAQLGDIAMGNPKIVREYEAAFSGAPSAGRRIIVNALKTSGDKETLVQVESWLSDAKNDGIRSELEELQKHLKDTDRKHARDRPAREPKDLDLLWVNFFVTGEYAPISRILDVFDLPDAKENEVLKRVAKWSMGSNLQQHPKLVELVQKNAKDRPQGSKAVIDQLILKFPVEPKK